MALSEALLFDEINGKLVITDQTDWAAMGVTLGTDGCDLYIKVVLQNDTTQVLYDNLNGTVPDIVPFVSTTCVADIDIPVDSDGNTQWGDYIIYVRAEISAATEYELSATFDYIYQLTEPEMCLTHQVNCVAATVTSRDETDYGQYLTTITRAHKIYPPPAKGSPKSGTQPVLIFNGGPDGDMWTGTWTQEVISTVLFTLPSGATVIAIIEGTREFSVECDTNLCLIQCCLKKLVERWARATTNNPKQANEIFTYELYPSQTYIIQFFLARDCGNAYLMDTYMQLIKDKSGCTGNCGCSSDEPRIITPITGNTGGDVIVDSPNGSITVTPETVGTTTYYHLAISNAIMNIINNLTPVAVASGNSFITVSSATIGGIKTYYVSLNGNLPVQENHIEILARIYKNPSAGTPGQAQYLLDATFIDAYGAQINPSANIDFVLGQNTPNLLSDIILLDVADFVLDSDAPLDYTVHAQIMRKVNSLASAVLNVKDIEAEVCWFDADTPEDHFVIRMYNPIDGTPKKFSELVSDEDLYLSISIYVKPN